MHYPDKKLKKGYFSIFLVVLSATNMNIVFAVTELSFYLAYGIKYHLQWSQPGGISHIIYVVAPQKEQ